MKKIFTCKHCGKEKLIKDYRPNRASIYCSLKCRYLDLGNTLEKKCLFCGKKFFIKKSEAEREGRGKFCSKECYVNYQRKKIKIAKCLVCENDFEVFSYKRNPQKFCSRKCYAKYRKRDKFGKFIKGEIKGSKFYREIAFSAYNIRYCEMCGYDKIPEILQINHLDGDRTNNNIENLQIICPTCHYELEFFKRKHKLTSEILKETKPKDFDAWRRSLIKNNFVV